MVTVPMRAAGRGVEDGGVDAGAAEIISAGEAGDAAADDGYPHGM